jgi:hypothetical protein
MQLPRGVQGPASRPPKKAAPRPMPAQAPSQQAGAPAGGGLYNNTGDLLNPDKKGRNQALYGRWGGDPKGNNEIGRMFRDLSAGWYPISASRVGFANEVEPMRQAMLRQAFYDASPMGQQSAIDDARAKLQSGAIDAGNTMARYLRANGGGIGAEQGAMINSMNQANNQAGQMQQQLMSPQGQMAMRQMLSQLYGQAQDPGLEPLAGMFGAIEQRHQQNAAEQASGGFAGSMMPILGQMAGAGAFNGWVKPRGR